MLTPPAEPGHRRARESAHREAMLVNRKSVEKEGMKLEKIRKSSAGRELLPPAPRRREP
jgi:hypothetical protein